MIAVGAAAAALAIGAAMTASAASLGNGQWCTGTGDNAGKYWFAVEPDGSKWIANTWHWVQDSDGVVRCYYFDANGFVVTNTTVDGAALDADGHWTVDGVVQTNPGDNGYYSHSVGFIGSTKQAAATTNTAATSGNVAKGNKHAIKASSSPEESVDALEYGLSTIAGTSISNAWGHFTMTLASSSYKVTQGDAENRIDFMVEDDNSNMVVRYMPLNYYGTADITSFAQKFAADKRNGVGGATVKGTTTLGGLTFVEMTKAVNTPSGTMTDHSYVKVVDGTNYVMAIIVTQNGDDQSFSTSLATLAAM